MLTSKLNSLKKKELVNIVLMLKADIEHLKWIIEDMKDLDNEAGL